MERRDWWEIRNQIDDRHAHLDSDPFFLARITVNYLRHWLTSYEKELHWIAGKVGVEEGCDLIKTKVLVAIASKYLWLAEECRSQSPLCFEVEGEKDGGASPETTGEIARAALPCSTLSGGNAWENNAFG